VRKQTGENTRAVHLPAPPTPSQQPLGTPVFRTASFAFGTAEEYRAVLNDEMPGYTYSRIDNPTVDAFARAVAALEGVNLPRWPAAQAFASGMAAISGCSGPSPGPARTWWPPRRSTAGHSAFCGTSCRDSGS
jgi:Cystathionine beta-lyases/cystathionine gamma-synthases